MWKSEQMLNEVVKYRGPRYDYARSEPPPKAVSQENLERFPEPFVPHKVPPMTARPLFSAKKPTPVRAKKKTKAEPTNYRSMNSLWDKEDIEKWSKESLEAGIDYIYPLVKLEEDPMQLGMMYGSIAAMYLRAGTGGLEVSSDHQDKLREASTIVDEKLRRILETLH